MSKINRWSILVGAVLGLFLGLGLKSTVFSTQEGDSQRPVYQSDLSQDSSLVLQLERNPLNKAVAEALKRMDRTHRWLWLATQAETASASEMPRLLQLARDDEDLVKMLGGHWAKRDPEHMLRHLMQDWRTSQSITGNKDLRRQLIRDWVAHGDVQALVDVLSDEDLYHNDHDDHDIAIDAIMVRDPGLGMELMNQWGLRNLMPDMKNVRSWAEKDPGAAALAISKLSAVHARRDAMGIVAEVWADDPQGALAFAKTSLTGKGYVELTSHITKQWTANDLDGAIAYAKEEKDPALLKALAGPLSAAWAEIDPAAALAWSQESLSAPARVEAVSAAIGVLAKNDLDQGAQLVQQMAPGGAKNSAAGSLLKSWVNQPHDVESIGKWLVHLDDKIARKRALDAARSPWVNHSRESAKAFLESDYGHLMPLGMVHDVIDDDVMADPMAAIAWASSLDVAHAGVIKQAVIENWHDAQPEAANQWIARQKKAKTN